MGKEWKIKIILAGFSQQEVARRMGISPSRLSRIVNGWVEPTLVEEEDFASSIDPIVEEEKESS